MTDVIDNEVERSEPRGRRDFLGKTAVAAAVAAVSGVAIAQRASAGAGNGVNMTQGAANTGATVTTSLAGGSTFKVIDGSSTGPAAGTNPRVGSIFGTQSVSGRAAVMGETTSTSGGWAIYGRSAGDFGIGVYGLTSGSQGYGVWGEHVKATSAGTGVVGKSNNGPGVWAGGTTYDLVLDGVGKLLVNKPLAANALTVAAGLGTIARDASGALWYCAKSGTPGEWHTLSGPGGAGSFYALTPGRVYDSRYNTPGGAVVQGTPRTVSVKDRYAANSSTLDLANFVPAGATAIAANVTVVSTTGSGFLTVNPGGVTTAGAATVNWYAAGQILNNGVILTLNTNRELTIVCGGSNTPTADVVIDVTGYWR